MDRKERLVRQILETQFAGTPITQEMFEQNVQSVLRGEPNELMTQLAQCINSEFVYLQPSVCQSMMDAAKMCYHEELAQNASPADMIPFEFTDPQKHIQDFQEIFSPYTDKLETSQLLEAFKAEQARFVTGHAKLLQVIPDINNAQDRSFAADINVQGILEEMSMNVFYNGQELPAMISASELEQFRANCEKGVMPELAASDVAITFDAEKHNPNGFNYTAVGELHLMSSDHMLFNPDMPYAIYRDISKDEIVELLRLSDLSKDDIARIAEEGILINPDSAHSFVYTLEQFTAEHKFEIGHDESLGNQDFQGNDDIDIVEPSLD